MTTTINLAVSLIVSLASVNQSKLDLPVNPPTIESQTDDAFLNSVEVDARRLATVGSIA